MDLCSNSATLKIKDENIDHKTESTGHFKRCIRIWMVFFIFIFFYCLRPVCNSRVEIGLADRNTMKLHIIKYYDMSDSKNRGQFLTFFPEEKI